MALTIPALAECRGITWKSLASIGAVPAPSAVSCQVGGKVASIIVPLGS
ncbi:hypothetical protein [Sphingomonas beigongshangi]|nr:hypothetical protein [Sphingomonas beigongshangi]